MNGRAQHDQQISGNGTFPNFVFFANTINPVIYLKLTLPTPPQPKTIIL